MKDVQWAWDPRKALANKHKHGVSFELAERVFDDPWLLSLEDPCEAELRWRSIGQVAGVTLIYGARPNPTPHLVRGINFEAAKVRI